MNFAFNSSKQICLRYNMGFLQASSLHQPPTNVTFQLSDGTIDANKESLASFSPVFEKMFNSKFKEKMSSVIPLPADNLKTIKQLLDIIYKEGCEMDGLDDIIPLMEVVDRYQFNKAPFLHMCGEAVLSQLDSSDYLTLLPKYVSVMSEESHKKAADKIMVYTNNDFTKYDTKCLPENILLLLLSRNDLASHEIDIFRFLVSWYNYQTKELDNSLQLVDEFFQLVTYPLIIPQLLSSEVARCDLVNKTTLTKAFEYLYGSCRALGECDCGMPVYLNKECHRQPKSMILQWNGQKGTKILYSAVDKCNVKFEYQNLESVTVMKSMPLTNGIYSFYFHSFQLDESKAKASNLLSLPSTSTSPTNLAIAISDRDGETLVTSLLENENLVTLYVYGKYIFLKRIGLAQVKATISTDGNCPFSITIRLRKSRKHSTEFVRFALNIIHS